MTFTQTHTYYSKKVCCSKIISAVRKAIHLPNQTILSKNHPTKRSGETSRDGVSRQGESRSTIMSQNRSNRRRGSVADKNTQKKNNTNKLIWGNRHNAPQRLFRSCPIQWTGIEVQHVWPMAPRQMPKHLRGSIQLPVGQRSNQVVLQLLQTYSPWSCHRSIENGAEMSEDGKPYEEARKAD